MEGTIKYCYLMTGTDDEKGEKYNEYKVKLTDIDKISDYNKAVEAIAILRKFSKNSIKPFECSVLSEKELAELSKQYPKKERDSLKRKWSYQSLLRNIAQVNQEYEAQLGTLSIYALTSYFGHYDWTGVSSRNAQVIESINQDSVVFDIVHGIRILSNVLSMELLRILEYMRGNKYYSAEVVALSKEILESINSIDKNNNNLLEKILLEK